MPAAKWSRFIPEKTRDLPMIGTTHEPLTGRLTK